jgi:hypothetical protein
MIRRIIISALVVLAFTAAVIVIIPKTKGISINPPPIETVGLPDHGLILIGPKHPTFSKLLAENTSSEDKGTAKPFSVFVVNNALQSIAACVVKWEVLLPDGQIATYIRSQRGSLEIVSDGQSSHFTEIIVPNGSLLNSLIEPTNSSGRQIKMGGGGPDITRQLSDSVKITAFIDGVLFVDGTFVGPDSKNYFEQLRGEIEATRDLNIEIDRIVDTSTDPEAMKNYLETLAQTQPNDAQQTPGKDPRYSFWNSLRKKEYAKHLLLMRKTKGDKVVSEHVRAELSKPRVNLRKL